MPVKPKPETKSSFLGFTFWKGRDGWRCRPANDRRKKLYDKTRKILCRKKTAARPIRSTFMQLNRIAGCNFTDEEICKVANSRLGWYRRCGMYVVNYAINPGILGRKTKDRPGLADPLAYYLN